MWPDSLKLSVHALGFPSRQYRTCTWAKQGCVFCLQNTASTAGASPWLTLSQIEDQLVALRDACPPATQLVSLIKQQLGSSKGEPSLPELAQNALQVSVSLSVVYCSCLPAWSSCVAQDTGVSAWVWARSCA